MFGTKFIFRSAPIVFMIMVAHSIQSFPAYGQLVFAGAFRGVITVERSVIAPADEAEFLIGVTTDLGVSEQSVLDALQGIGISAANLSVSRIVESTIAGGFSPMRTVWNFQFDLILPLERAAEVRKKLDGWRQKPPAPLTELVYGWRRNASQRVATDVQATLLPEMIAEGRRKANALAAEAGRPTSGSLEYVSDPAPTLVGESFGGSGPSSPLAGASFRGAGTALTFSLAFRFARE